MRITESRGMSAFFRFVNRPAGRLLRIVGGSALLVAGYRQFGSLSTLGPIILMALGFAMAATASLDLCPASAILGGPLRGKTILQR